MNKNKIYIFGAGGHTRSLISLLKNQSIEIVGIYDDTFNTKEDEIIGSYKVIGDIPAPAGFLGKIILSYGDNLKRKGFYENFKSHLFDGNISHSTSSIDISVKFGTANFMFARTVINTDVQIGDNNIINTGSIIEHEVKIGSHNHISVGSILCGRVNIGNECFIGAGAVINDKIKICDGVTIGSNSVVIKSINESGIYVGNPVRKIA